MPLTHYTRINMATIIFWYRLHFDKSDYDLHSHLFTTVRLVYGRLSYVHFITLLFNWSAKGTASISWTYYNYSDLSTTRINILSATKV